ncbi:MAG: hypothetical protein KY476_09060 [Planctomycetes bacterium]|nr:hypothetical protein [Planctomycetota bacterium]
MIAPRTTSIVSRLLASLAILAAAGFATAPAHAQTPASNNIDLLLDNAGDTQALLQNLPSGTGVAISATNGGTVNVQQWTGNSTSNNAGNGMVIHAGNGGAVNGGNISGNQFNGNGAAGLVLSSTGNGSQLNLNLGGAGLDPNDFSNNGGGGIELFVQNNGAAGVGIFNNTFSGNGLGGVNATIGSSLTSGGNLNLFVADNSFSGNGDFGIGVSTQGTGLGNLLLFSNTIGGTVDNASTSGASSPNGSGIHLSRNDNSNLNASVIGNDSSGNAGSGLTVNAQGGDSGDPNNPAGQDTPNQVLVQNNTFDSNGGDGAEFNLDGDTVLLALVMGNQFLNNAGNGVSVFTGEDSVFGNPLVDLAQGRSVFDGNSFLGNGQSGLSLTAAGDGALLVNITSITANTVIGGNLGDGISITASGTSSPDIVVDGGLNPNFATVIQGNGGHGVSVVASSVGSPTVSLHSTLIGGLNAGEGNGGHGLSITAFGGANPVINLGGQGAGSIIAGNAGDGINLTFSGSGTSPTLNAVDSIVLRNGGNGLTIDGTGPANTGFASASMDVTFSGTTIAGNAGDGVNVLLRGEFDGSLAFDRSLSNNPNIISSNGGHGILVRTDPGDIAFPNGDQFFRVTIPGDPAATGTNTQPMPPYDPDSAPFTSLGSAYGGNYRYRPTELNVNLTLDGNIIQNNGTGLAQGEGVFLQVGTNSTINATVTNNTFGGNLNSDFRTGSFVSGSNPPNAINNANPNDDFVFLDHTARLNLFFDGNTGDSLDVSRRFSDIAVYTNNDPGKNWPPPGNFVNDFRRVHEFTVFLGSNNIFSDQGQSVSVQQAFQNGVWNVQ